MDNPVSNGELCALILMWAKEAHPEKYDATLKVATIPATFRRYLLRLVELRWEAEPEWREQAPVLVLDETKITGRVKNTAGDVLEMKGQLSDLPHMNRWWELGLDKEEYANLQTAKKVLDLEYVYD